MEQYESDPDYPTCERCYATLCIDSGESDPTFITTHVDIEPTTLRIKGQPAYPWTRRVNMLNLWELSSQERVKSKDLRDHLEWIFEKLEARGDRVESLRQMGCDFRVWCYWLSREGHGGPTFSVPQVEKLARFRFEVLLDVYFHGGPEPDQEPETS
jgi:hypothetical protein